jgi:hypothetical protein
MNHGKISNFTMLLCVHFISFGTPRLPLYFQTVESETTFEGIFSQSGDILETKTDVTAFLKDISGL